MPCHTPRELLAIPGHPHATMEQCCTTPSAPCQAQRTSPGFGFGCDCGVAWRRRLTGTRRDPTAVPRPHVLHHDEGDAGRHGHHRSHGGHHHGSHGGHHGHRRSRDGHHHGSHGGRVSAAASGRCDQTGTVVTGCESDFGSGGPRARDTRGRTRQIPPAQAWGRVVLQLPRCPWVGCHPGGVGWASWRHCRCGGIRRCRGCCAMRPNRCCGAGVSCASCACSSSWPHRVGNGQPRVSGCSHKVQLRQGLAVPIPLLVFLLLLVLLVLALLALLALPTLASCHAANIRITARGSW